jgi:hypothetical protein
MALCRPCARGAYFENAQEVTWPDMNWRPRYAADLRFFGGESDFENIEEDELCFAAPNASKKEKPSC